MNVIKHVLPFFLLAISLPLHSQFISSITYPDTTKQIDNNPNDPSVKAANTITAEELKAHLTILASDEYEGRDTGFPGNARAADFISNYYNNLGTKKVGEDNGHKQSVAFTWSSWKETNVIINRKKYRHLWDYLAFPTKNTSMPPLMTDEIVFIGYGIADKNYNDYKKAKVKNKVVLMYEGLPNQNKNWVDNSWTTERKLQVAKEKGAKMVLIIANDIKVMLAENRKILLGPTMTLGKVVEKNMATANHIYISPNTAQDLWGEAEDKIIKARDKGRTSGKPKAVKFKTFFSMVNNKKINSIEGHNVLGFIEGSDKKEEIVVVSAHYDHIGKKGDDVYNGADDNASGTSAVMEMAQAFVQAKKEGNGPRRSVLCLHVTGEEKGLLGSAFYASNPVFPLENTVVNVNVDMIGRVDKNYTDNPDYIYVIGSDRLSTTLHRINEDMNSKYAQITLDYTYNSESDPNRYYYRSDHYNFAVKGIPAIFYFSGVHEDYHMSTDTADKIQFDKMEKIARLIFHTTWELANREERITVNVKP